MRITAHDDDDTEMIYSAGAAKALTSKRDIAFSDEKSVFVYGFSELMNARANCTLCTLSGMPALTRHLNISDIRSCLLSLIDC